MSLEAQIKQMRDANFQQFASEQEKRTKAIMDSLSRYEQTVSKDNSAYLDAIKDVVEKTGDKSSRQLGDSLSQLNQLGDIINKQQELSNADRAELKKALAMAEDQINSAKSRDGIISKIGETISNNAIDITSVVGGLTSNSPAVMFATKYVLDKRKQAKEEKAERKKAAAEEQLTRLEALAAAKANKEVAEKQSASVGGGAGPIGGVEVEGAGGSELVVWNEIQAEELEKIRLILERTFSENADWRADQEVSSRNDEEARRDKAKYDAAVLAALEQQANISADQMDALQNSIEKGLGDGEGGGIFDTIKSALGFGAAGGAGGMATAATGALGRAASMAGRFAPAAGVAVGGAMIGKDVYDIASAAFDDDIMTDAQGGDIGGVIGGALLGTIGAFVAGPLGAGIGMSLGNMVGEFVGNTVAPNYAEVQAESEQKIQASKEALRASMASLDEMYRNGMMSEADYTEQRAAIESQQELVAQQEEDARQVRSLNELRLAKGQAYNDLQASITRMEENGVEVSQSMYDQLEVLEQEYYDANEAFEQGAADLQAKVDPSWWQSLTGSIGAVWNSMSTIASSALTSLSEGFTAAKENLSARIDALGAAFNEKVDAIKNWASETADAAFAAAGEAWDSATEAVTDAANYVDEALGVSEKVEAVGEAVGDAVDAIDETLGVSEKVEAVTEVAGELYDSAEQALTDAAASVGEAAENVLTTVTENETVQAAVETVSETAGALVDSAEDGLEAVGDALGEAADSVGETLSGWGKSISGFFGFGGDDDEVERLSNMSTSEVDNLTRNVPRLSGRTAPPVDPGDPDENTRLMVSALQERGITDPEHQANILGMLEGESGMQLMSETSYRNTSPERIRAAMGRRASGYSDEELNTLKQDDEAFFNAMYGDSMGNEGEGYKYRGRGFIQLTGKDNYERIGEAIGVDLVNNPDLLTQDPQIAALAAAEFMKQSGSESGLGDMATVYQRVYGVNPENMRAGSDRDYRMNNLRERAGYASGFLAQLESGELTGAGVEPPVAIADVSSTPQDPVTGDWMAGYSAMGEQLAMEAQGGGEASTIVAPQTNTIANSTTVSNMPMGSPRRSQPHGAGVGGWGWLYNG